MGHNEVEFLVDEAGVRDGHSILEFSHPELYQAEVDPVNLADHISFENIHLFAHHLVMSDHSLGTQLLDELIYWREQGRI